VDKIERACCMIHKRCSIIGRYFGYICVYVIKSRQMESAGRVARIEDMKNVNAILVEKLRENESG
jgi:hypothetical protein